MEQKALRRKGGAHSHSLGIHFYPSLYRNSPFPLPLSLAPSCFASLSRTERWWSFQRSFEPFVLSQSFFTEMASTTEKLCLGLRLCTFHNQPARALQKKSSQRQRLTSSVIKLWCTKYGIIDFFSHPQQAINKKEGCKQYCKIPYK